MSGERSKDSEPLTDEEIERLLSKHERDYDMVKFARAIERAHGIGAPPCATGDCIPNKCNICEVKE